VVSRLFCLKYDQQILSVNTGVFKESQERVRGDGCSEFLGDSWCEEQGRALGGGRAAGDRSLGSAERQISFKESQVGVRGGGCSEFLGDSCCEERGRVLGGGRAAGDPALGSADRQVSYGHAGLW